MMLRSALFAPLATFLLALPAQAELIPLRTINTYLNGLVTAATDFTQINADGSISTGTIKIKRPGRMRFEYAPPEAALVLASAGQVAIFDAKSNQPPEQYPLSRTPLNLILSPEVDLTRTGMVVTHAEVEGTTRVVVQDPDHPDYGSMELVFTDQPLQLRQWVITDDLGSQTTVILGNLAATADFPPSTFSITAEQQKRQ